MNPLVNTEQQWSGERMILIPSLVDDNNDSNFVVPKFVKKEYKNYGVVALVPSNKRANYYKSLGAIVSNTDSIYSDINKLKNKELDRVLVINNRYDGIDLPDESCRILIMDSIPYFNSLAYKYEEQCRFDSVIINTLKAQKIEQGLGRGVRGEKDYSVIIIVGSDLVKFIRSSKTNKLFSGQTRKQIEVGIELAKMAAEDKQVDESSLKPIASLINQSLKRDEGWKAFYQNEMNDILVENSKKDIYDNLVKEAKIEKLVHSMEYEKACDLMQKYIDELELEGAEKGWYLQQLARFTYFESKERALTIQQTAFKNNFEVLKPRSGVSYKKISYINENRMNNIRMYLNKYKDFTELQLDMDKTLSDLSFSITSEKFEKALQQVGELLGYKSQRPDKEIRKGPDNLWCGVDEEYLLFECKSEVEETRDAINKKESGQMNNHCAWFENEYGVNVKVANFLIIPTKKLSYNGDFSKDVRIIRASKLNMVKTEIRNFVKELKKYNLSEISLETLQKFIDIHHLNSQDFIDKYSEKYYHDKK